MNPFDPTGSFLVARQEMEQRQKAAAFQRMIRCCREVLSVRVRLAGIAAIISRRRQSQVCT